MDFELQSSEELVPIEIGQLVVLYTHMCVSFIVYTGEGGRRCNYCNGEAKLIQNDTIDSIKYRRLIVHSQDCIIEVLQKRYHFLKE